MKTKLEMAHDYAMVLLKTTHANHGHLSDIEIDCIKDTAFALADEMQAEADKRKVIGVPEAIAAIEWQPDWSRAPEWAKWWAFDGDSEYANWYKSKPYIDDDSEDEGEWNTDLIDNAISYHQAPSFNYQGDWKDSLRERP